MENTVKKKEIRMVESSESYKIIVKAPLEEKIRKICARWPNNEWSGTLFYNVIGSFETKNLVIEAVDFYLQDKGEGAFTQFQNDVTLATYMVDNDLIDCYQGLMHSHDRMAKLNCFNK